MYNYMEALQHMFFKEPACDQLRTELAGIYQTIRKALPQESRKDLLALSDKEDELSDAISLASFIAGFRLAAGITMELSGIPFPFDEPDETNIPDIPNRTS